jgi:hypothetical protein
VLDEADGSYSLVAALSLVAEPLRGRIETTTGNGVCCGTWSAFVVTLSHFLGLAIELELLGSRHNTDLIEDQVDALWIQAHPALDSLVLYVLPSVARSSLDGTCSSSGGSLRHLFLLICK